MDENEPTPDELSPAAAQVAGGTMNFLTEWLDHCRRTVYAPSTRLYHYTDASGLLGILQSRQIWATNPVFMNDQTELLHSLLMLKEIVGHPTGVGGQAGQPNDLADRMMIEVADNFYQYLEIYAVCFCAQGDLLSQWRAYGKTVGYAIGFDPRGLVPLASGQTQLRSVTYDENIQRSILHDVVRRWRLVFADIKEPPSDTQLGRIRRMGALTFAVAFAEVAVAFKHGGFQEEQEWRLITRKVPFMPDELFPTRFRERDGIILSYVEVGLSEIDGQRPLLPISEVRLGPRPYIDRDGYAVVELLKSLGYEDVKVGHSAVPLRA